MVILNLVLRNTFTGHVANAYGWSFFEGGMVGYIGSAAKILGRLFLPPHPDAGTQLIRSALLLVVLGAVVGLVRWHTRKERATWRVFGVLLLCLLVACSIGIVGGVSTRTSESDRFLYLPSAFLCILAARAIACLPGYWWRYSATGLVIIVCSIAMRRNHAHWKIASHTIKAIVEQTPAPPPNRRLLVWDLPGDHQGAFIFRHGYREALGFAGRDASRIHVLSEGPSATGKYLLTEAGDTLQHGDDDRWFDAGRIAP